MAFKRWEDHTPRWQREHSAAGETKTRWNRFLTLSPASRKSVDMRKYAAGESIATQRKTAKQTTVLTKMAKAMGGRSRVVELGLSLMTAAELRWTANASEAQIRARAGNPKYIGSTGHNPWWYR